MLGMSFIIYLNKVSSSVNAIHLTALFDKSFLDKYLKIVIVFRQCPLSVFGTFNTVVGMVLSEKILLDVKKIIYTY